MTREMSLSGLDNNKKCNINNNFIRYGKLYRMDNDQIKWLSHPEFDQI